MEKNAANSFQCSVSANCLDVMSFETTIAVIDWYFRINGFLDYNIKTDDFIKLIKKYISQHVQQINLTKPNNTIKLHTDDIIIDLYSVNKDFLIFITLNTMLSIYI